MRQISPDKKRTYVYSKTQGRLKPNARTFETKRKYISSETPLRFNPNVKAFFYQEGVFKKNNVHSPGKLTGNCGRFVYKIICDA